MTPATARSETTRHQVVERQPLDDLRPVPFTLTPKAHAALTESPHLPGRVLDITLDDLLGELADVACAGIFAIQHFTKDETRTAAAVMAAMDKAMSRALAAKAAATPHDAGPVCGCGYDDCSACAGYGWACLSCGHAFFGAPPCGGLCPSCQPPQTSQSPQPAS
jgi:hypothetical protein